ncbi:hypothetical protein ACFX13_030356 [Malus domestica]
MDPPPRSSWFFSRRIGQTFLHARTVLRRCFLFRYNTENEWPEGTLPITEGIFPPPPPPHPYPPLITPTTYPHLHHLLRSQYSQASGLLRGYLSNNHTYYIVVQNINTNTATNPADHYISLGKMVLSLAFQAVVALVLSPQSFPLSSPSSSSTTTTSRAGQADESQPRHPLLFNIFGVAMVFAFAGSFSGIFQRVHGNHGAAAILGNIGNVSAAIGFFLITSIFLPGVFAWIRWLACGFTLLCFGLEPDLLWTRRN